jgi:primosomal protein N' (replication factor Y)
MDPIATVDVALDPKLAGVDAIFTYIDPFGLRIGAAVLVPLARRRLLGYVVASAFAHGTEGLKPVEQRVEGLSIPAGVVDLARHVAEQYLCPLNVALSPGIPPGVSDRLLTTWKVTHQPDLFQENLPKSLAGALKRLQDAGGELDERATKRFDAATLKQLRELERLGYVIRETRLQPVSDRASDTMLCLSADAQAIEEFLQSVGDRRPAQALAILRLQQADAAVLSRREIKALTGATDATIRALYDAGILTRGIAGELSVRPAPHPNATQKAAIDAIETAVQDFRHEEFLLFGVTGSGKTEVYLRAAASALKTGRRVLYIVPEIALATQAIGLLRERFGAGVAILHSDLPAGERLRYWSQVQSGGASVVVGTRSALFAPVDGLGLIVLDEEHESAYKQDSAPRYHAHAVARFLARQHRCPLVLGSATPGVETFYQARSGKVRLLELPSRAAAAQLPDVTLQDLRDGYRTQKPALITETLQAAIQATLLAGKQAIIFLNRRAYSPALVCRECGERIQCPNCAVSLSFHRNEGKMRCHHCGYLEDPPDLCPACGGTRIFPLGIGTEKVEATIREMFPIARVARLDRDVTRRRGALEEVLAGFRARNIDILVGTQVVAKGLDFPNVTLVGVVAADVSLNLPDFRSSERTFQLLSQVAGRAGRGVDPGRVIIQTFSPDHVSVTAAKDHDYLAAFEALILERKAAGYPPFQRLVNIVLSGTSLSGVTQASSELGRLLESDQWEVLGPASCPVERIQQKWRRHLLIKLPPDGSPAEVGRRIAEFERQGVQLSVDVDPGSLM